MLPITSYINQVMNQLEFHYSRVEKEATLIQDPTLYILQKEVTSFKEAVIFFVHFIIITPEIRSEFEILLESTERKRSAYIESKQIEIKDALQKIGNFFLNNPQYMKQIQIIDIDRWAFPHTTRQDYTSSMNIKEFLFFCIECPDIDKWNYKVLSRIYGNLLGDSYGIQGLINEGICPYENWAKPPLAESISLLGEIVKNLEEIEVFEYSFTGSKAASFLNNIYSICTMTLRKPIIPSSKTTKIQHSSDKKLDIQECVRNCNIIYNYLKHKMSMHLSKQAVIKRFVTYMELYFQNETIPEAENLVEKYFQREFERFAFLHGIYPLSEAQLRNARIDDLLTTPEQSFICELKQIGFGIEASNQVQKKTILDKLRHAVTQSRIYNKRLISYHALLADIYIIIVSRVPFILTEDHVEHNETTYHFSIIDLSNVAPSKQAPIKIDINEILG